MTTDENPFSTEQVFILGQMIGSLGRRLGETKDTPSLQEHYQSLHEKALTVAQKHVYDDPPQPIDDETRRLLRTLWDECDADWMGQAFYDFEEVFAQLIDEGKLVPRDD